MRAKREENNDEDDNNYDSNPFEKGMYSQRQGVPIQDHIRKIETALNKKEGMIKANGDGFDDAVQVNQLLIQSVEAKLDILRNIN